MNADQRPARSLAILVCEDEMLIRMDTADLLRELGHRVIEAADGATALACLAEPGVDVLWADVGLPDMNGIDLAHRARGLAPGIAVIHATGDPDPSGPVAGAIILLKPYGSAAVVAALEDILSRG